MGCFGRREYVSCRIVSTGVDSEGCAHGFAFRGTARLRTTRAHNESVRSFVARFYCKLPVNKRIWDFRDARSRRAQRGPWHRWPSSRLRKGATSNRAEQNEGGRTRGRSSPKAVI